MFGVEKQTAHTRERGWETAGATLEKALQALWPSLEVNQEQATGFTHLGTIENGKKSKNRNYSCSHLSGFLLSTLKKKNRPVTHPGPKDKTGSYRIHKLAFIILYCLNRSKAARTPNKDLLTRDCKDESLASPRDLLSKLPEWQFRQTTWLTHGIHHQERWGKCD